MNKLNRALSLRYGWERKKNIAPCVGDVARIEQDFPAVAEAWHTYVAARDAVSEALNQAVKDAEHDAISK